MAFEKWKNDEDYKEKANEIKKQVEEEFIDRKFEVPAHLTKEKTKTIVESKQKHVNNTLLKMLQ